MSKRLAQILLIAILALSCVGLVGCGSLRYSVSVGANGSRVIEATLNLTDATDLEYQRALDYLTALAEARRQSGRPTHIETEQKVVRLIEEYATADEYEKAVGITGWETGEGAEYKESGYWREYRSTMTLADHQVIVSYALGYLSKEDPTAYNAFVGWWRALTVPDQETKEAVQRVATAADFDQALSAELDSSKSTAAALYEYAKQGFAHVGYDMDEMTVKFDYQHLYQKSVYAKDATVIRSSDGNVYEWETTLAALPELEINIYQKAPAVWAWELTAIAAGVLVIGVVVAIVAIRRKKQNAPGKEV